MGNIYLNRYKVLTLSALLSLTPTVCFYSNLNAFMYVFSGARWWGWGVGLEAMIHF